MFGAETSEIMARAPSDAIKRRPTKIENLNRAGGEIDQEMKNELSELQEKEKAAAAEHSHQMQQKDEAIRKLQKEVEEAQQMLKSREDTIQQIGKEKQAMEDKEQ